MTHDEAIEAAARVLCDDHWQDDPDLIPCHWDDLASVEQNAWRRTARAVAPILTEHGARLMQEKAKRQSRAPLDTARSDNDDRWSEGFEAGRRYAEKRISDIDPAAIVNPNA
jgi:hypothetical protein